MPYQVVSNYNTRVDNLFRSIFIINKYFSEIWISWQYKDIRNLNIVDKKGFLVERMPFIKFILTLITVHIELQINIYYTVIFSIF